MLPIGPEILVLDLENAAVLARHIYDNIASEVPGLVAENDGN